jgi:hypothetical protein
METTMSETLRLLKFDPAVALLIMANNQLNTNLMPQYAEVSAPTALDEFLTSVVITTHPSNDDGIYRRHTGSITYRYNRIHVADIFGSMRLDLTPPTTVGGVMTNLANASGLVITDDDFENGLVTGNSFVLKAKPQSLRWVGETTVMLNDPGEAIQLSEAFPINILDGLYPPVFS